MNEIYIKILAERAKVDSTLLDKLPRRRENESRIGKRRPKMIGNDKVLHFLAGLSIAALLGVFLPAPLALLTIAKKVV